jgi:hypothetical protein
MARHEIWLTIVIIHISQRNAEVFVGDVPLIEQLVDNAAIILVVPFAVRSTHEAGIHPNAIRCYTKLSVGKREHRAICG